MRDNEDFCEPLTWGVVLMALLACLLLDGCGRGQQPPSPPIPEVTAVTVQPEQVVLTTQLPGRTSAYLIAEIRPQVNGIL